MSVPQTNVDLFSAAVGLQLANIPAKDAIGIIGDIPGIGLIGNLIGVDLYTVGCLEVFRSITLPSTADVVPSPAYAERVNPGAVGNLWGYIYVNGQQITQGPLAMCIDADCHTQSLSSPWYYRENVPVGTVHIRACLEIKEVAPEG